ncbi:unnamed protein product [Hermetia illucens]|uniref:C2H2-type domain-containing protein n=1 Tax=Hermetia illucens TaxID=343691 RepID=A0A7R8UTL2_HERIL|nr:unnamed protein product [Hermetia illucens]
MDPSGIPEESQHEFIVKEEFVIEDVPFIDCQPISENPKDSFVHKTKTKCGEIMLNYPSEFILVCALCRRSSFTDFHTFGTHIQKVHLNLPGDIGNIVPKEEPDEESQSLETDNISDSTLQDTANVYGDEEDYPARVDCETDMKKEMNLEEGLKIVDPRSISHWNQPQVGEADIDTIAKGPLQNKFGCTVCGRIYKSKATFRRHLNREHPDMIQDKRERKRNKKSSLEISLKTPNKMTCVYCNEQFSDLDQFREHMTTHTVDCRYICPYCPKTFSTILTRKMHIYTHEGVRPFKCPHCPKAFANPTNLKTHLARIHLKIYKFKCNFCDKPFVKNSDKRVHERTHTKERPSQCQECGKRFVSQGGLTEHIRSHKNIKNYKCDQCDKAFLSLKLLKSHVVVHTTERPFGCNICAQTFTRKGSLRRHKLIHSKIEKYTCKVCGKNFVKFEKLYSHMKSHDEEANPG